MYCVMSIVTNFDLSDSVVLRPVSIDDMSSVRYVHEIAFRILAAEHHSEEQLAAHIEVILQPEYIKEIRNNSVYCAWVDGEIVGTSGWCPADDNGTTARIRKVFVRPLFSCCGIGRLLLENAEARAYQAGFTDFSVRANVNAVSFYTRAGYEITSHGVMSTNSGIDLPVAFMRKKAHFTRPVLNNHTNGSLETIAHNGWWAQHAEHKGP